MTTTSTKVTVVVAVLLAIAAAVMAFFLFSNSQNHASELAAIQSEIDRATAAIETQKAAAVSAERQANAQALGMDESRVASDEEMLYNLLSDMCTWTNGAEYAEMRERVSKEYKVPEDSWLMKEFLPEIDIDNTRYGNTVDGLSLNMSLKDADIRCMSSSAGTYSYFVQVTTSSDFIDQTGEGMCAFEFDVNSLGEIVRADGMAVEAQ